MRQSHSQSTNFASRPSSAAPLHRPPSARPTTAASNYHSVNASGSYIVAVLEGRGIGREVGIAALDRDTGKAVILQLADCQTYVKTLHHLHLHPPQTILVPDTFLPSDPSSSRKPTLLVQCIQEEFGDAIFESVGRKYWNDVGGLEFITQLMIEDEERAGMLMAMTNKYYALSAAAALFKYVQTKLNSVYAPRSLRINYIGVEGTMMIDTETAKNLELVGNMTHKKSNHCLYGVLNHTFTPMAARLLRVNILAPITIQSSINARLDAVEELVQTEDKYTVIKDALRSLKKIDLDKLISSLSMSESRITTTPQNASTRVTQMLQLRSVFRSLPAVQNAVEGCRSSILRAISSLIHDGRISNIDKLIGETLNEDAPAVKSFGIASVNVKVFAVKANHNRMLDVARETYRENVGDIFELARSLSEAHDIPLSLIYQEKGGGFWFSAKKEDVTGELPRGFLNVSNKGAKWAFTTMELKKMNARMKDSLDETLLLSDKIIQDLLAVVLNDIGVLYKASEAISLLDMLWAFAHASILHNYVRPEYTGTLAIKAGRHPVLEGVQSAGTFVPNDTYACESAAFQIIQGPNMSGKSTYLRQIGLLTVMAMCGCFVPAEYASFRLHDALLTRLSNDDDPEKSLSTFSNEMASSAMILSLATEKSLILIDELGRGTSPHEGIGISHAIAESLINLKAFVFFATHFADLTTTLGRNPTVVNLHLGVHSASRRSSSGFNLRFQYRILDGCPKQTAHYGLELANLADLPVDAITEARKVATHLADMEARRREESRDTQVTSRRKTMIRLRTQLKQAFEHSALPDAELAEYLAKIQRDVVVSLGSVLDGEGE